MLFPLFPSKATSTLNIYQSEFLDDLANVSHSVSFTIKQNSTANLFQSQKCHSDWTRTPNHLVRKRILNHLAKLAR